MMNHLAIRIGIFNGIGNLGKTRWGAAGGYQDIAPDVTLSTIISTVIGVITLAGGLWFIVQFFIGALNWITAGSDKDGISKAQKRMTNSLIGLIVLIGAYSFIGLVGHVLGIDILDFITPLRTLYP